MHFYENLILLFVTVPTELPGPVTVTRPNNTNRIIECGEQDDMTIIDGPHPPAMLDQQLMIIPNIDPDIEYSVQVRVIVLTQSEPLHVRFGVGRWSGDVCKNSTGNTMLLLV